jgi:hypothetical protein
LIGTGGLDVAILLASIATCRLPEVFVGRGYVVSDADSFGEKGVGGGGGGEDDLQVGEPLVGIPEMGGFGPGGRRDVGARDFGFISEFL